MPTQCPRSRRLPFLEGLLPLTTIHHPAGQQHGSGFVKVELIPNFQMQTLPKSQRDGDLPFGSDGDRHGGRVRRKSKEFKPPVNLDPASIFPVGFFHAAAITLLMTDHELLAEHVSGTSSEAFTELVRRHLPLVLSTARRRLSAPDQADDVAQQVFTLLARKARTLPPDVILSGWLYRTTCLVAGEQNRSDHRRRQREHHSVTAMNEGQSESDSDTTWREIQPLLDEAMTCLTERDRDAVVLRFFEGRSLKDVGEALGISPDAAQKRLSRSLDRLRESLARQHRIVTPASLAAAITAGAIEVTPTSTQAATIAATALSAASSGISLGTTSLIAMSTLKTLTVGVVSAALVTVLVLQQKKLREIEAERDRAVAAVEAPVTPPATTTSKGVDPELLRLRGEVARLRGLSNELASLRSENSRLRTLRNASSSTSESLGDGARQVLEKMQYLKAWMYAFHQYLEERDGVFPKSFEEVTAAGFQVADGPGFSSSELEILYKGRLDEVREPARIIVLREREVFRDPAGNGFNRAYAFADGHVEIHRSPDEDLSTWERDHSQLDKSTPPTRGL